MTKEERQKYKELTKVYRKFNAWRINKKNKKIFL